ncbi:Pex12 amino terminal region-domain-containing protein [Chytriomyces sp. MP71]|nr:Pex12 amino terminal region-domain-containing protein [Chytriomyces sp. MP71]
MNHLQRPSVFELHSASTLSLLVKPAARYCLAWFGQQRFSASLFVARIASTWRFDALFALLSLLVETQLVLTNPSALASERFYGLKRVSKQHRTGHLSTTQKAVSLLAAVLLPWIAEAAEDSFVRCDPLHGNGEEEEGEENLSQTEKAKRRGKQLFVRVYPLLDLALRAANASFVVAYLFGKSDSFTLLDHLFGIAITRWTHADYKSVADAQGAPLFPPASTLASMSPLERAARLSSALVQRALRVSSTYLIPAGIFAFRFMEWWYASEYHNLARAQEPIPAPPKSIQPHPDGIPLPEDLSLCPLCLQQIKNPAMLVSGYVYCYTCIYRHAEAHGECPVSKIRIVGGGTGVRKLYAMG